MYNKDKYVKNITKRESIEILDNLVSKSNLSVRAWAKARRIYVSITRKHYSINYAFRISAFEELYFGLPAWIVTKYFSGSDIKYVIYNK